MIERDLCHSVDVDHRGVLVLVLVLGRSSMVEWLCEKMAHRQSGPGDSPRPAGLKIRFRLFSSSIFQFFPRGVGGGGLFRLFIKLS